MAQIIICAGISVIPYIRPVGPFQLANVLRRQGYSVQVIDQFPWIAHLGLDQVLKLFKKFVGPETLWIGLSSTWFRRISTMATGPNDHTPGTVMMDHAMMKSQTMLFEESDLLHIRNVVHDINPRVKFVLGGARAPEGRARSIGHPLIDAYIEGYADNTVVRFSQWCQDSSIDLRAKANTDGTVSIIYDAKAIGFDYNNFKFTWSPEDLVNPGETLPMEIARGCIFNCGFCSYPLNGRRKMDYLKDPGILREQLIENYEKYGTTNYFFLDDTFNDSVDKLRILSEQTFSNLSFRPRFGAFMRLDLIAAHPETMEMLANIGVSGAFFGVESLNHEANKSIGKGISRDRIVETLLKLKTEWPSDVITDGQFIMGLPHEDHATISSWLDELLDPAFPLDAAKIEPLWLEYFPPHIRQHRLWLSQFDLYPEKYGYTFPNPDNEPVHWVNNRGFSLHDAIQLKRSYGPKWKVKEKSAWVGDYGTMNIGVPADLIQARREGRSGPVGKSDYHTRIRFVQHYIQRLMDLQ
jgi:hypothetical protein